RGQSHGALADRIHAPRPHAREHGSLRARGAPGPPPDVGRRGLGEPLVARAASRWRGRDPRGGGRRGGWRMTTTTRSESGTRERTIAVWQSQITIRVLSKGSGPALVFFHGPW